MNRHKIQATPEYIEDLIHLYGGTTVQPGLLFTIDKSEHVRYQLQHIFNQYLPQDVTVVGVFPSPKYMINVVILCDDFDPAAELTLDGKIVNNKLTLTLIEKSV